MVTLAFSAAAALYGKALIYAGQKDSNVIKNIKAVVIFRKKVTLLLMRSPHDFINL